MTDVWKWMAALAGGALLALTTAWASAIYGEVKLIRQDMTALQTTVVSLTVGKVAAMEQQILDLRLRLDHSEAQSSKR
jgi:hypothetical protein